MTSPVASEPNVAAAPPGAKPSGAIRLLWWCVMLMPTVGGPLIFVLPGLFLLSLVPAFIVAVDSVTDRHLTREQRLIGVLLSAAVIPAAIIGVAIAAAFGVFGFLGHRPTALERVLTLASTAAAVLVLLTVKPRVWQITKKSEWKP